MQRDIVIRSFERDQTPPIVPGDGSRTWDLAKAIQGLPDGYALVACCGGCDWHVRLPVRLGHDHHRQVAAQHLVSAHITEAAAGRCVLDEALLEGTESWIASRLALVNRMVGAA